MASSQGPRLPWPTIDEHILTDVQGLHETQKLLMYNLYTLLTPLTADLFLRYGLHPDWLSCVYHCIVTIVYLSRLLDSDSGAQHYERDFGVYWIYSRHSDLKRALNALLESHSAQVWREKFDAKDLLHQIFTMILRADARYRVASIEESIAPVLAIDVRAHIDHAWVAKLSPALGNRGVVLVMATHMEGLRALAHMLLVSVRANAAPVIDSQHVRHALGAFLHTLNRLVHWIERAKHADDRLAPIMPME